MKKRIVPHFEVKPSIMFNAITKIDDLYLQSLVNQGATIISERDGFTVMGYSSMAHLFIHEDCMTLECITTFVQERGKGSGTKLMNALTETADKMGVRLELRATKVSTNPLTMSIMAINIGSQTKGKIPVGQLPKWYEKFGFEKVGKDKHGTHMVRIPREISVP